MPLLKAFFNHCIVTCQGLTPFPPFHADIEHLLARFLPRRDMTKEEVILQLEHRHRQRQEANDSHIQRQRQTKKQVAQAVNVLQS